MNTASRLQSVASERRVDSLFKAMHTDFLLREQFVTDPSQVISEYVSGNRLPEQGAIALNHVVYSIAASRPLLDWLRGYAVRHARRRPSLDQFLTDFSHAVSQHHGSYVVHALIGAMMHSDHSVSAASLTAIKDGILHVFGPGPDRPGGGVILTKGIGIGDTDDETFNTFKTEGTWTGTGTDTTWTTMDTETGTIFTAGGTVGTETTVTDLETWHTGTDTGTGTDSTGTDSTGTEETGTEETGTDDGRWGFDFSEQNYAVITLVALNRYATHVVRMGALAIGVRG